MISYQFKIPRMGKLFFCIFTMAYLSACGSAPPRQPVLIEQAHQTELSAHRAMRDGNLLQARELFVQSLHMQQSLDNLPGTATAIINLATVAHLLKDDSSALELLDRIVTEHVPYPQPLRAVAAFRKAVILVDSNMVAQPSAAAAAESALEAANHECLGKCAHAPGLFNLRARLALQKGEYAIAAELADNVIRLSSAEKAEQANAHRIIANAEAALGQHDAALTHYLTALGLDKELGLSARIALDLNGIAKMLGLLGRKQEADSYAHRAASAIEASRSISGHESMMTQP